jgi:AraC-like DNA-binding protein
MRQVTAVNMPADPGIGTLASRLLAQLATGMDHYTPAEAARLTTAALEVLAVRLARALDADRSVPPETRHRALLTAIHAFIQRHMSDPDLSPETIATAHHISLRLLHKLFNEEGETVAGWIRTRRLEGTRRDLADPAQASRPVAALAAHWGFRDATSFSRTFRAAYGLPPHQYRLTSNPGYCDPGEPTPADEPHGQAGPSENSPRPLLRAISGRNLPSNAMICRDYCLRMEARGGFGTPPGR